MQVWKSVQGGVVWTGMNKLNLVGNSEKCVVVLSMRVWESVTLLAWNGSRKVWVKGKTENVKYAWVCVYAPMNTKTVQGKDKIKHCWKNLNNCINGLRKIKR